MGPIWGRQDPGGPHVGPMNFALRVGKPVKTQFRSKLLHAWVVTDWPLYVCITYSWDYLFAWNVKMMAEENTEGKMFPTKSILVEPNLIQI